MRSGSILDLHAIRLTSYDALMQHPTPDAPLTFPSLPFQTSYSDLMVAQYEGEPLNGYPLGKSRAIETETAYMKARLDDLDVRLLSLEVNFDVNVPVKSKFYKRITYK